MQHVQPEHIKKNKQNKTNWEAQSGYESGTEKSCARTVIGWSILTNLSRGLCLPRVRSIFTLLTATSSSLSLSQPLFCKIKTITAELLKSLKNTTNYHILATCEQMISCAVTSLKCSILSLGTAYSLQNCHVQKQELTLSFKCYIILI